MERVNEIGRSATGDGVHDDDIDHSTLSQEAHQIGMFPNKCTLTWKLQLWAVSEFKSGNVGWFCERVFLTLDSLPRSDWLVESLY